MPELLIPKGANLKNDRIGVSSTVGTAVTSSATPNTKGSWVQLTASSNFDINEIILNVDTNENYRFMVDVGIGAAGSEVAIISNVLFQERGHQMMVLRAPFQIPQGTRIAARCQANSNSRSCLVSLGLNFNGPYEYQIFQKISTYGANLASTLGTTIDPGTTANTKGAWTQFTASCNFTRKVWINIVGDNGGLQNARWLMDIGIGGAGSEFVAIPNLLVSCAGGDDRPAPSLTGPFHLLIPSGTRIAGRLQCSITAVNDRNLHVLVFGGG